jgi:hypothetical protein
VKHRNHMIPCLIIAAIILAMLALGYGAPLGAGVGLTLLLCPLLMGAVMWLLMRQPQESAADDDIARSEGRDQPQHVSRGRQP